MKENKTIGTGLGFCDILCVAFIVLKICGVIKWSWLWVLSPLWIQLIVVIIFAVAVVALSDIRG